MYNVHISLRFSCFSFEINYSKINVIIFFEFQDTLKLSKKLWQGRYRSQSVVLNNSRLWVTGGTVDGELIKDTEIIFDVYEKPIRVTDLFAPTTGHAIVLGMFNFIIKNMFMV